MRTVCMIPARLGSRRIKNKVLRNLGGKPLIQYIIETCKQVFSVADIYLNATDTAFRQTTDANNIRFYERPSHLSTDEATNNEYIYDFLKNVKCDYLVQANPTSPFVNVDDVKGFLQMLPGYDVLLSVKKVQAEFMYKGDTFNFCCGEGKTNSEDLEPLYIVVWGLTGLNCKKYIKNYEEDGHAIFGHKGDKLGYYVLGGFSTIDIDWEKDFRLAEAVARL